MITKRGHGFLKSSSVGERAVAGGLETELDRNQEDIRHERGHGSRGALSSSWGCHPPKLVPLGLPSLLVARVSRWGRGPQGHRARAGKARHLQTGPTADQPPRPGHGLCSLLSAEDEAGESAHRLAARRNLGFSSRSFAQTNSLTGRGRQAGLLTGLASALRERTRSPRCAGSAGGSQGRGPRGPACGGAQPRSPYRKRGSSTPGVGADTGPGKATSRKAGWGGLHSSQRETHTRPVVCRAVTPEDACPDPQSRGACGSPHPAEGALRM